MEQPFYFYSHSNVGMAGDELAVVTDLFGHENVSDLLADIPPNRVVFPRFRAIPFGAELEREVAARGSVLINSYPQHRAIADLFSWVADLDGLTPPAYTLDDMPYLPEGEYFVKGETNSIKNNWFSSAYAATKSDLIRVVGNVMGDQYVGSQSIVIRPFQHYRKLTDAVDGRPVFHERRAFVLDGQVLSSAFYWSSFADEYGDTEPLVAGAYERTLNEAVSRIGDLARFIVIDCAEYEDGTWGVIELNDGSMSGLSENDPSDVWGGVLSALNGNRLTGK